MDMGFTVLLALAAMIGIAVAVLRALRSLVDTLRGTATSSPRPPDADALDARARAALANQATAQLSPGGDDDAASGRVSAELRRLSAEVDKIVEPATHPKQVLEDPDFQKGVELLVDEADTPQELLDHLATDCSSIAWMALGALHVVVERATDAPDRIGTINKIVDGVLGSLKGRAPWGLYFTFRILEHAERPVFVETILGIRSWHMNSTAILQFLNDFAERRKARGEVPSVHDVGDKLGDAPYDLLERVFGDLDDAHGKPLLDELREWKDQRLDAEQLNTIGRVWDAPRLAGVTVEHPDFLHARARIERTLFDGVGRSVLVIGAGGVGKTSLIRSIAERAMKDGWHIFEARADAVNAGQTYVGALEERIQTLVRLLSIKRRVIWYVPNFHELVYAGRTSTDRHGALDMVLPSIDDGTIRVLGETQPGPYEKAAREVRQIESVFERVRIEPVGDEVTLAIARAWDDLLTTAEAAPHGEEAGPAAADASADEKRRAMHGAGVVCEAPAPGTGAAASDKVPAANAPDGGPDGAARVMRAFDTARHGETASASTSATAPTQPPADAPAAASAPASTSATAPTQPRAEAPPAATAPASPPATGPTSGDVLEEAHELAKQFVSYRSAPGRLVDLVKLTHLDHLAETGFMAPLTDARLHATLSRMTGLPEEILDERRPLDIDGLRTFFTDRVLGQAEAVECLVYRVSMIKAGLTDPTRPAGVFLFAGPTGTGKTEIAKTLAHFLFGSPERLIRLDMSEFKTPDSVARITGGAASQGRSQALVHRIRRQPFSVVLLDEFEKANPEIWDLFLQVFDDGRLSDDEGETADFRHSIIILTSNLGSAVRTGESVGFESGGSRFSQSAVERAIKKTFRLEFVNRLDRVVVFRPLDRATMRDIIRCELEKALERRGLRRRQWTFEFEESAIDFLLERGFTPDLGARPLKRAIERHLLGPLAMAIVQRQFPAGDQRVRIRRFGDGIQGEFTDVRRIVGLVMERENMRSAEPRAARGSELRSGCDRKTPARPWGDLECPLLAREERISPDIWRTFR